MLRRVEQRFGAIPPALTPRRVTHVEPPQVGERRVVVERPGTTAYLKVAWHAPAATDPDFFPMLVLDAALTGAKGVNLWASFPGARAAAQSAALHGAGRARPGLVGRVAPCCRPRIRSSTRWR